jgi:hypothetical protein
MNKVMKVSIGFIFLTLMAFTITPKVDNDCGILHKGTFTYGNSKNLVKVMIKGKNHIEYHNDGKYYIKSKLDWVNECEYNMTMTKVTIPDFPYGKGDVMNVTINKVDGNKIYYTSTIKGQSWNGIFTKIE